MIKRIIYRGSVIGLMLWSVFALVPRAFAQDPNRLSLLNISIWPEYDRPTVLVMFDGTLADASNLPREVSVLIPSSATLHVATYANTDGSLAAEQPTTSTVLGDGYTKITFMTRTANYHVEYYADLLRGSPDKTMDFVYKAALPADAVTVEVQQPLQTTNFSLTPPSQNARNDPQGFKYYSVQFPALGINQTLSLQGKYTKSNPNPSVSSPVPAAPATATPESSQWTSIFLLVAIIILGLTAVFGFLLMQRRSREPVPDRTNARNRSRRNQARASGTRTQVATYCTQCGHGLGSDDNFCPRCGSKRRIA